MSKHYHAIDRTAGLDKAKMAVFSQYRAALSYTAEIKRTARKAGVVLSGNAAEGLIDKATGTSVLQVVPCRTGKCSNWKVAMKRYKTFDIEAINAGRLPEPEAVTPTPPPPTVPPGTSAPSTRTTKRKATRKTTGPVAGGGSGVDENDIWAFTEAVLTHSRRTLLYGPPGTGKTTAGYNLAAKLKRFVSGLTLTEEMPAAELRGHFVPKGEGSMEFVWHHGPGMKCWLKGGILILNEINEASGDMLTFLHGLLDDASIARMTLPSGEEVEADKNFRCIATMNGVPEDLPEALRSRFPARIEILTPHPDAIKTLSEDLREAATGTAAHADPERRLDLRKWKAFDEMRTPLGAQAAAFAVFGKRSVEVLDSLTIASAPA